MPSFFQPDPARRVAALEAKVEELANVVRRGKPAANMRDLKDGELFDAADGQVPVYDASVGMWRPGSAGGDLPTISLANQVSHPSIAASANTDLRWRANDAVNPNVGGAFTWSSGSPQYITVVDAAVVLVTVHAILNQSNNTYVGIKINGLNWGGREDVRPVSTGYSFDIPSITMVSTVDAGDLLYVTAFHDGTTGLTLQDASVSVTRLWQL